MARTGNGKRWVVAGAVGLLALLVSLGFLFVDVGRYKPRLESAASRALGMDVRFGGPLKIGILPIPHLSVEDGKVLGERAVVLASAKKLRLWVELLPLLRGKFQLHRLELVQPWFSMERGAGGRLNVAGLKHALTLLGELDGARVSIRDGTFTYVDGTSGRTFEASHVELAVSRLHFVLRTGVPVLKALSFQARLGCGELRAGNFVASALELSVVEEGGVFEFAPVTMHVFGGEAAGSLRADHSGAEPSYLLHCSLPRFRIEEFIRTLSVKPSAEGWMDFTAVVSMRGRTRDELMRSLSGKMSLQGRDLVLEGSDLDRRLARYDSSQNFNLVDVGGVFFAGPLSLVVTRGLNTANLFSGAGGSSRIVTLVSEWRVEHGVASAQDVAMATARHRIALQGGLDLASERFADVTIAEVDAKGCARLRQEIRGPFEKPEIGKPHLLTSIAGPMLNLYRRARGVFPEAPCEAFYSGSVPPPD
jgi:AsmA protein